METVVHFPSFLLYRSRENAARLGTLLAGLGVLYLSHHMVIQHDEPVAEAPINLVIVPPPAAPERVTPEPQRKVIEQPQMPPQQPITEPQQQTPVAVAPSPAPSPVALPSLPVSPAPQVIPANVEPPRPRSNSSAESLFAQDVRSSIERKKIYPETARDLGISGTVEVSYVLDRSGKLLKAEISVSSGYKLLDKAALAAVQSAAYRAFPVDAWVGEDSKEFHTRLVFSIND